MIDFVRKPLDIEDKGRIMFISVPQYLAQCLAYKRFTNVFERKKEEISEERFKDSIS